MPSLPQAQQRVLETPFGPVVGASYRWDGGQYCALHTSRGVVGCGIFDLACADAFSMAFAICRGTPEHPLRVPEDIYEAKVTAVSAAAAKMGISPGMTGLEAVEKMLRSV
ncbi:MAG: YunC family protein [Planctomycetales bacterium]|nr:YunC family protein [Planctomycetales bacterium]